MWNEDSWDVENSEMGREPREVTVTPPRPHPPRCERPTATFLAWVSLPWYHCECVLLICFGGCRYICMEKHILNSTGGEKNEVPLLRAESENEHHKVFSFGKKSHFHWQEHSQLRVIILGASTLCQTPSALYMLWHSSSSNKVMQRLLYPFYRWENEGLDRFTGLSRSHSKLGQSWMGTLGLSHSQDFSSASSQTRDSNKWNNAIGDEKRSHISHVKETTSLSRKWEDSGKKKKERKHCFVLKDEQCDVKKLKF